MATGELSDDLPNLFVTAGFTFSIWGVLYILLALFTVYQLLIALKRGGQEGRIIDGIGLYFFIASLANHGIWVSLRSSLFLYPLAYIWDG